MIYEGFNGYYILYGVEIDEKENEMFCEENTQKGKQHKHADLIKQWADGEQIQYFCNFKWQDIENPSWHSTTQYRVKPKDRVLYAGVANLYSTRSLSELIGGTSDDPVVIYNQHWNNEIKLTYDAVSGKLKGVELL